MSFNPEKWNVDLTKHRKRFFIGSGLSMVLGIVLLLTFGLNLGVDFESGSNVEIQADQTLTQEQLLDDFAAINESYTPNITLEASKAKVRLPGLQSNFPKMKLPRSRRISKTNTGIRLTSVQCRPLSARNSLAMRFCLY